MVLTMSYNQVELLKSIEELSIVIRKTRDRVYDIHRLIRVDYDTVSKIFWTDDSGLLDMEYTAAVDSLNRRWSNWCKDSGLAFRREPDGVRIGLLDITDFDNGIEVTMSNILSKALGDEHGSLTMADLNNLDGLDLKKLSNDSVTEEVISKAIDYLNNLMDSKIHKMYEVWIDITNESFGLELINFFKRRMVDAYKVAYDDVFADICELMKHEQTKDAAQEIFDELYEGAFYGIWYESIIKSKQSLSRILEIAETRNKLQRLLD